MIYLNHDFLERGNEPSFVLQLGNSCVYIGLICQRRAMMRWTSLEQSGVAKVILFPAWTAKSYVGIMAMLWLYRREGVIHVKGSDLSKIQFK